MLAACSDVDTDQTTWWERMALLHYTVLRTTNAARIIGGLGPSEVPRALWQSALEGAKGSRLLHFVKQAGLTQCSRHSS